MAFAIARAQGDEYANDPNIFELTASNFDKVVHSSNYTTIVKFYAPWCGYCQQLKPIYKKLGKFISEDSKYSVNVAAVNCDKDYNKQLCSLYQVTGFPSLMVFRPPKYDSKKPQSKGRHAVETYNGTRSLKAMVSFLTSRIKNYVKKFPSLESNSLKKWLENETEMKKVLLVTSTVQLHPMYKSLAIDFLGSIKFGMVTTKSLDDRKDSDSQVKIPEGELPMLLIYENGQFSKFETSKLNDKSKITEWIIEESGIQPGEGPLSKLGKKFEKYRTGKKAKKSVVHDEL